MPIQILMPSAAGDGGQAAIAHWCRRSGETVRRGETLLEVETDKAVVEVEAPGDGVLAAILADAGTKGLAADAVLGLIALPGEDPAAVAAAAEPTLPGPATGASAGSVGPDAVPSPGAAQPTPAADATGPASRVAASPLARRLARQAGLDLRALQGSGPRGRIVRLDVERGLAALPAAVWVAGRPDAAAPPRATETRLVPHTTMRRVIAQRLGESKRAIPHFYLSVDCDVEALLALRAQIEAQAGFKPSVNDFVVRAVALALARVPAVNASWSDEGMLQHARVDVSVAVATRGGLVTPIVRNADEKSLATIHAEVKALAGRARDGRLEPGEYQGGGFTISNLGMHGVREFFAIVNPPQAAILGVGACEQRAVVRDGSLAVGTRMTCSLSADHRVVDGAVGAEFLAALRGLLEAPLALIV